MREWFINDNEIKAYNGTRTDVVIPQEIYGEIIDAIGDFAFSPNKEKVKEETSNVRRQITRVILPDGITRIGTAAFSGCASLKEIVIPKSVVSIGDNAFDGCISLENVIVPPNVDFGLNVFHNCTALKRFSFPQSYTCTPIRFFQNCISIEEVELPPNLLVVGCGTFDNCKSLKNLVIPASVRTLEDYAFGGCTSFEKIIIPDGVTELKAHLFNGCTQIREVLLPHNLRKIHQWAFRGCTLLKSIELPEGLQEIDAEAFEYSGLESITIPASVETIYSSSFKNCQELKRIIFKGNETTIKDEPRYLRQGKGWSATVSMLPDQTDFPNLESIVIAGCAGSYAESYASKYGIRFEFN